MTKKFLSKTVSITSLFQLENNKKKPVNRNNVHHIFRKKLETFYINKLADFQTL
jgi:hypothetical protein